VTEQYRSFLSVCSGQKLSASSSGQKHYYIKNRSKPTVIAEFQQNLL